MTPEDYYLYAYEVDGEPGRWRFVLSDPSHEDVVFSDGTFAGESEALTTALAHVRLPRERIVLGRPPGDPGD